VDPGGVGGTEFEDLTEHEGDALVADQALQHGLAAVEANLGRQQFCLRAAIVLGGESVGQTRPVVVEAHLRRLLRGLPAQVQQVVDADAVGPREQLRLAAPGREVADHAQQDLLCRVLRLGRSPHHAQCQPIQRVLQLADYGRNGGTITRHGTRDEFLLLLAGRPDRRG
jgi:hypothetical protein